MKPIRGSLLIASPPSSLPGTLRLLVASNRVSVTSHCHASMSRSSSLTSHCHAYASHRVSFASLLRPTASLLRPAAMLTRLAASPLRPAATLSQPAASHSRPTATLPFSLARRFSRSSSPYLSPFRPPEFNYARRNFPMNFDPFLPSFIISLSFDGLVRE
jgi:hypothetical protein